MTAGDVARAPQPRDVAAAVQVLVTALDLRRTVQVLLLALEGGDQWEIDNAVALARQTLALLDS